jgi:hypothetical protein
MHQFVPKEFSALLEEETGESDGSSLSEPEQFAKITARTMMIRILFTVNAVRCAVVTPISSFNATTIRHTFSLARNGRSATARTNFHAITSSVIIITITRRCITIASRIAKASLAISIANAYGSGTGGVSLAIHACWISSYFRATGIP